MTWDDVGTAVEELAAQIEAAQFTPDAVLALARGGLPAAGALAASVVRCDFVWRRTDRWIEFPWSTPAAVAAE